MSAFQNRWCSSLGSGERLGARRGRRVQRTSPTSGSRHAGVFANHRSSCRARSLATTRSRCSTKPSVRSSFSARDAMVGLIPAFSATARALRWPSGERARAARTRRSAELRRHAGVTPRSVSSLVITDRGAVRVWPRPTRGTPARSRAWCAVGSDTPSARANSGAVTTAVSISLFNLAEAIHTRPLSAAAVVSVGDTRLELMTSSV